MDTDKIKDFLILHFEKMLLGMVVALSLFLIYSGLGLPNFLEKHQPDKLSARANEVRLKIDEDHNEAIIEERKPTFDILRQTEKLYTPVDSSVYKLEKAWESQNEQSIVRRQDPVLLPVADLRTHGVLTSIAIKGSTTVGDYPLAGLEPADPVEKVEVKARREPRRSRRNAMMDDGMGMGMDDMGMDDMGMDGMMMDEMMMMSGGAMDGAASGPVRKLKAEFDFGFRPVATEDKRNPKPAIGWFIAGTALLPHRDIYEAYELALKDAEGYDPRRDTPLYFNLEVQRADVTDKPVDQLTDADWLDVWNFERYAQLADGYWSGFAPELVHEDYRDVKLTVWIPPVLLDDYSKFSLHPKIPMLSQAELTMTEAQLEAEKAAGNIEEFDFDKTKTTLAAPGMQGSGYDGGGYDMDMGMDMDMDMMGGGMGMYGRGKVEKDPVEHKLLRFYDFAGSNIFRNAPKFGRSYVYRIRYAVVDPNFPSNPTMQPKTSSLGPEVARRVTDRMIEAAKTKKRDYQLWSDWSAPSQPSTLPTLEQYFAGPVEPAAVSTWNMAGKEVEYQRDPPKAKIVAAQFIPKLGVKVPMRFDVTEGGVLSHKAEFADAVDPISMEVKKMPDAEFLSATTVVDIEGGKTLKIAEGLAEPGMMLLFDQSGQLQVSQEIADLESYRIQSFADERGE